MTTPQTATPSLRHYIAIARPDHWVKHIFMLPGVALALISDVPNARWDWERGLLGLVAACLIASANYVINEWLDRDFDRHHPRKRDRPAVRMPLKPSIVWAEYVGLAVLGLLLATRIPGVFFLASVALLVSGVIYNVAPLRSKDRVYLDVTSEAINNPIRLALGWGLVSHDTLPPSSLLLAYWLGGAFLMAVKRFAEYRDVAQTGGTEVLALYRRSFASYTENRLLVSAFLYAQLTAFFLAVFLIKYRVEYLLSMPLVAVLFATYLGVGLKPESRVQAPERLFQERVLIGVAVLLALSFIVLTLVEIPGLERLASPHYLNLP